MMRHVSPSPLVHLQNNQQKQYKQKTSTPLVVRQLLFIFKCVTFLLIESLHLQICSFNVFIQFSYLLSEINYLKASLISWRMEAKTGFCSG